MAKYNNQKAKILFLQQMLYETGADHTISMKEILDNLQEKGIRAERKSIYDDMEVLRFFGMDIRFKRERPSGYYIAGMSYEIPRLQSVVSKSMSLEEPEGEAQALGFEGPEGEAQAPGFEEPEGEAQAPGSEEPEGEAQAPGSEEPEGEAQAQGPEEPEGEAWVQGPEEPEGEAQAPESEEPEDEAPEGQGSGLDADSALWMKPGKPEKKKQMRLQCSIRGRKLAWDYFGDLAEYKRRDDECFIITAPVLTDSGFFGWLTAAGGDVRIVKPKKTAQAYREYLKTLLKEYK